MKTAAFLCTLSSFLTVSSFAAYPRAGATNPGNLRRQVERAAGGGIDEPSYYTEARATKRGVLHLHARMKNGLICHASSVTPAYCQPGAIAQEP